MVLSTFESSCWLWKTADRCPHVAVLAANSALKVSMEPKASMIPPFSGIHVAGVLAIQIVIAHETSSPTGERMISTRDEDNTSRFERLMRIVPVNLDGSGMAQTPFGLRASEAKGDTSCGASMLAVEM